MGFIPRLLNETQSNVHRTVFLASHQAWSGQYCDRAAAWLHDFVRSILGSLIFVFGNEVGRYSVLLVAITVLMERTHDAKTLVTFTVTFPSVLTKFNRSFSGHQVGS